MGDHVTPGSTFAPPPNVSGYIPPFPATVQQPPFPQVSTIGGQIPSNIASLIASRDNIGMVTSIIPPGRERVSLEDETSRMRAEQERKEYDMRCQFEAEKKRMEQRHRVELEKREKVPSNYSYVLQLVYCT